MNNHREFIWSLIVFCAMTVSSLAQVKDLEQYNIKWTETGNSPLWSMPVGGCDIGCNVWVENGSIIFYFGRSNSFDENNALLKSGRVQIEITPNPFVAFKQELYLAN